MKLHYTVTNGTIDQSPLSLIFITIVPNWRAKYWICKIYLKTEIFAGIIFMQNPLNVYLLLDPWFCKSLSIHKFVFFAIFVNFLVHLKLNVT